MNYSEVDVNTEYELWSGQKVGALPRHPVFIAVKTAFVRVEAKSKECPAKWRTSTAHLSGVESSSRLIGMQEPPPAIISNVKISFASVIHTMITSTRRSQCESQPLSWRKTIPSSQWCDDVRNHSDQMLFAASPIPLAAPSLAHSSNQIFRKIGVVIVSGRFPKV